MDAETLTYESRAAWLDARRTFGIGSSDAPALLGLSRYQTPFGLYTEKLGLQEPPKQELERLDWGNILEEPIAQRYAQITGRIVRNPRPTPTSFVIQRSRANPFMLAAVDRYTKLKPDDEAEGVLEIKNAHLFMGDDWLELQEPPAEFQVQLQHQLAVTGAPWGSIACLIGGCNFVWKDIARDEEFIELLITKERDFWNRLITRDPPPIDGSEKTKEVIGRLHPKDTGQVIELDPSFADLVADREKLKAIAKETNAQLNVIEGQLKLALGDNSVGTLRDGSVISWKWQTRQRYAVEETSFRQLRVKTPQKAAALSA